MYPINDYLKYRMVRDNKKTTTDTSPEHKPIIPGNRPPNITQGVPSIPNNKPTDTTHQEIPSKNKDLERAGQFELKEIKIERTVEQKPVASTIVPVNKPNPPPKKDDIPSDGMGRLNMNDFF